MGEMTVRFGYRVLSKAGRRGSGWKFCVHRLGLCGQNLGLGLFGRYTIEYASCSGFYAVAWGWVASPG